MTSWVVSTISGWLVPVYIAAMVLIFAVPRPNRPRPAGEDDAGEPSPVEDPLAASSVEVEAEAKVDPLAPEVVDEAPPKPRKRRVRARKSAKGAPAPDADADAAATAGVTWVRVGPGKFVRSVVPVAEFVGPPAPEPDEESRQDPLMDQDDAGAGFANEHEHESESTRHDDSEPVAEERGVTPSTPGDGSGIVRDFEAGGDVETWAPGRSSAVGLADSPTMEAPERRAAGFGLFFSASIRRPRRTVEPIVAVFSRRLANARRAVETSIRRRAEAVRGRRFNVHRDFHPRSPPGRRGN